MCTYWQKLRPETGLTITWAKYWQVVQYQNVSLPCLLRKTQERFTDTLIYTGGDVASNSSTICFVCMCVSTDLLFHCRRWDVIDYHSLNYANTISPPQENDFLLDNFNFVPLSKHFLVWKNSKWYIDLMFCNYISVKSVGQYCNIGKQILKWNKWKNYD